MFVKSIMKPSFECITVQSSDSLRLTLDRMDENGIDAVPVLEGKKYKGIITRHHIFEYYFNKGGDRTSFLNENKAGENVTHQEEFLTGDEIFENTVIALKNFPLLAVVGPQGDFRGIVTRFDVLEQFQSAFGMQRKGVRIAFTSVETEGRLAKFTDIAHQYHEHIISLVTFDEGDRLVRRIVMKIEQTANLDKFTKKLEEAGFRILSITED
ncbi:CBS domain-containing protein [Bacillus testis]|uniref:CBS domain-containing protein n=1 Tax=Bacillus testis TaxID=1622072 RepID=UPI00067EDEB1|nr:CBS domain-containing protein [Bacillus testis]